MFPVQFKIHKKFGPKLLSVDLFALGSDECLSLISREKQTAHS